MTQAWKAAQQAAMAKLATTWAAGIGVGGAEPHREIWEVVQGTCLRGSHRGVRGCGGKGCLWGMLVPRWLWEFTAAFQQLLSAMRFWSLEIRLLCVAQTQQVQGLQEVTESCPKALQGIGDSWGSRVGRFGQGAEEAGQGQTAVLLCRALSCLPGELWRVRRWPAGKLLSVYNVRKGLEGRRRVCSGLGGTGARSHSPHPLDFASEPAVTLCVSQPLRHPPSDHCGLLTVCRAVSRRPCTMTTRCLPSTGGIHFPTC